MALPYKREGLKHRFSPSRIDSRNPLWTGDAESDTIYVQLQNRSK